MQSATYTAMTPAWAPSAGKVAHWSCSWHVSHIKHALLAAAVRQCPDQLAGLALTATPAGSADITPAAMVNASMQSFIALLLFLFVHLGILRSLLFAVEWQVAVLGLMFY